MSIWNKALRAGISIFLSVFISHMLKLKYPFFAALPTLMLISTSSSETLRAGENRILGTLVGAVIGALLVFIAPNSALLCGIGIVLIIFLCNLIKWDTSASIAGLIFISIMVGIKGENPIVYSVNRTIDTMVGIAVTIIVNDILFYKNTFKIIENRFLGINDKIHDLIQERVCSSKPVNLDILNSELKQTKNQLNNFEDKYIVRKRLQSKPNQFKDIINCIEQIYGQLNTLSLLDVTCAVNASNYKKLSTLFDCDNICSSYKETTLNTVYNYHIGMLLENYVHLNELLHVFENKQVNK